MEKKQFQELADKAMEDNGAAFELAVIFKIDVWHGMWPSGIRYVAAQRLWNFNNSCYYDDGVEYGTDPNAATRLAIVRAAINRFKKEREAND